MLFSGAFRVNAWTAEGYNVEEVGRKDVGDSYIKCKFKGKYEFNYKLFRYDEGIYKGISSAYWLGSNPSNADSITLTDTITITGIGSPSFSASYPSGVSVGFSTSGKSASYSYSVEDRWLIKVDYSYIATILTVTGLGQKCSASFKFGNSFYVVDSEVDNYYHTSSHYFK